MKRRRSVYLADEQWTALTELGLAEDRSVNSLVRLAVTEYLARHSSISREEMMQRVAALLHQDEPVQS